MDILAEPPAGQDRDVLLVAVGAFGGLAVEAASRLAAQGIGVTVVDPRWALPVPPEIGVLAADHRLVVTVEDGGRSGGVGAAVTDRLSGTGIPVQVLAIPQQFLEPGPRAELLGDLGLTAQAVARGITEEIARNFSGPRRSERQPGGGRPRPGHRGLRPSTGAERRRCECWWWRTRGGWPTRSRAGCGPRGWPSTSPMTASKVTRSRRSPGMTSWCWTGTCRRCTATTCWPRSWPPAT